VPPGTRRETYSSAIVFIKILTQARQESKPGFRGKRERRIIDWAMIRHWNHKFVWLVHINCIHVAQEIFRLRTHNHSFLEKYVSTVPAENWMKHTTLLWAKAVDSLILSTVARTVSTV